MIYFGYPLDIHGWKIKPETEPDWFRGPNPKTVGEKPSPNLNPQNRKPVDIRPKPDPLPSLEEGDGWCGLPIKASYLLGDTRQLCSWKTLEQWLWSLESVESRDHSSRRATKQRARISGRGHSRNLHDQGVFGRVWIFLKMFRSFVLLNQNHSIELFS